MGAPRVLHRLQRYPAHTGLRGGKADNLSDFVVVHTFGNGHHQSGRQADPVQVFQGLLADAAQIGTAQGLRDLIIQRIKLQINFQTVQAAGGQLFDKLKVLRDTHAVGINHQMLDRASAGGGQNGKKFGVYGGLAAGELHHIGLALVGHHRIQHFFHLC